MVFSGMLFGDSCPLFAQAAFMFDPNGDRVEDIVAPGAIEGTWSIYAGGTDCVVIATIVEPVATELFGFGFVGAADISGCDTNELIALCPGFSSNGEMVGEVHLFSAVDGRLIWSAVCPSGTIGALGCAVVPDQDRDESSDLLIRLADRNDHQRSMALLISGKNGIPLRLFTGSMSRLAALARAGHILYAPTDLDDSQELNLLDALAFMTLAFAGSDRADVNRDGLTTIDDLVDVLSDANQQLQIVTDEHVSGADDDCEPLSLEQARSLYDPDVIGQFVICDPIGAKRIPNEDFQYDACEILAATLTFIEGAVLIIEESRSPTACVDSRPRPGYTPTANGCGSGFWSSIPPYGSLYRDLGYFTACCNNHDVCYGTCQSQKAICDVAFYLCMYLACDGATSTLSRWACRSDATFFFGAVRWFGQGAFDSAQRAACVCCDQPNPDPLCVEIAPPTPTDPPSSIPTPCNSSQP